MKKVLIILVSLLTISLAFVDLRIVGSSIKYLPGILGKGHPRLAEVIAIFTSFVFIINSSNNKTANEKIRIGKMFFLMCFFLMTFFTMFKPFFLNYLRSVCFIPTLFFLSILNLNVSDKQLNILLRIIYFVISISAIFVVISPYVDLGVSRFYIDETDGTIQRYIGFGSSLPYQACFNLLAIPLFSFLQKKGSPKIWYVVLIGMLILNVVAVFLSGARTAYLIAIVLFFYYSKSWYKSLSISNILLITVLTGAAFYYVGDTLFSVWTYRHGTNLTHRDEVWRIGMELVFSHPILGIQSFSKEGKQFGQIVAHVQNGYLEIIFWGGLFTLLFYLASFYEFYSSIKRHKDLNCCFIGIMLVYLIFMIAEILFYSVQDYYLILLIIGLLLANHQTRLRNLQVC